MSFTTSCSTPRPFFRQETIGDTPPQPPSLHPKGFPCSDYSGGGFHALICCVCRVDKLLDSGLYTGEITELAGGPGTGKTQVSCSDQRIYNPESTPNWLQVDYLVLQSYPVSYVWFSGGATITQLLLSSVPLPNRLLRKGIGHTGRVWA